MWSILGSRLDLPTTRLQARSGYDREQAHWHRLRVSRVCVFFLSTASHSWRRGAGNHTGGVVIQWAMQSRWLKRSACNEWKRRRRRKPNNNNNNSLTDDSARLATAVSLYGNWIRRRRIEASRINHRTMRRWSRLRDCPLDAGEVG